jgi:hypothetical protein
MWADSGYDGKPLADWMKKTADITLEIVERTSPHAFQVVNRRWVVERTFGWLMRYRRLARDYERLPEHHGAMIYWATVFIMTKRLARYETGPPAPDAGEATARTPPRNRKRHNSPFTNRLSDQRECLNCSATGHRQFRSTHANPPLHPPQH